MGRQPDRLERVGGCSDTNSIALLKEFANDEEAIVGESCQVALDMIEFELHDNSFEVKAHTHPERMLVRGQG